MSDITDKLDLKGASESVLDSFENSDNIFDGNSDEAVKEYKEDVLDPNTNAEKEFREALQEFLKD
jgi:hypothetical protein